MIKYPKNLSKARGLEILDDGLTVRKTALAYAEHRVRFMEALVGHFIRFPDPTVVPVHRFDNLSDGREWKYSYDMDLLGELSKDEKVLIEHYSNLYDRFGSDARFHSQLLSEERSLPRLTEFLSIVTEQFRYHDLHSGNIMIDQYGDYRIIDLEGFCWYNISHQDNNWITR